MTNMLAFFGNFGPFEITLILVAGVLIFGKRLPDVGKNIGKGIVEFKKGLKGVKDEIDDAVEEAEQVDNKLEQQKDEQAAIETKEEEKEKA